MELWRKARYVLQSVAVNSLGIATISEPSTLRSSRSWDGMRGVRRGQESGVGLGTEGEGAAVFFFFGIFLRDDSDCV